MRRPIGYVDLVILSTVVLLIVFLGVLTAFSSVGANPYPRLDNRSLYVRYPEPGSNTSYTISWRYPASTTVGSVRFELCGDPYVLDPCSFVPSGDLSSASLIDQSGATGFSVMSQSASEIIMTRPPSLSGTAQSSYVFDNITNPGGIHSEFYIRIYTYPTSDASGDPSYISSVASATASPIMINTVVPPILYFCAALSVSEWCEDVDGNFIDYGDLDPVNGHSATSQFGAATNALGGYVVTVNGSTMTSGNKKIEALSVPTQFSVGEPQFGINIRANTNPAIGQDAFGSGIGMVSPDYDTPDLFKYTDGDAVASAATGTLFNTYTVTYILNLPEDQPSGVYNTTIAYVCTAAF